MRDTTTIWEEGIKLNRFSVSFVTAYSIHRMMFAVRTKLAQMNKMDPLDSTMIFGRKHQSSETFAQSH